MIKVKSLPDPSLTSIEERRNFLGTTAAVGLACVFPFVDPNHTFYGALHDAAGLTNKRALGPAAREVVEAIARLGANPNIHPRAAIACAAQFKAPLAAGSALPKLDQVIKHVLERFNPDSFSPESPAFSDQDDLFDAASFETVTSGEAPTDAQLRRLELLRSLNKARIVEV